MSPSSERRVHREATEAYPADRAAALAGVPKSTLHYWASHDVWTPSVSPKRIRLWSLTDIVVLRVIYWLRRGDKILTSTSDPIPRTTMREVRALLTEGVDLSGSHLFVDHDGRVVRELSSRFEHLNHQQLLRENIIDVLAEYRIAEAEGVIGPDLAQPRPMLRIIPGKLAGEPHVLNTRVSTAVIDALLSRGYSQAEIKDFYPFISAKAVAEARSLEDQLRRNIRQRVA